MIQIKLKVLERDGQVLLALPEHVRALSIVGALHHQAGIAADPEEAQRLESAASMLEAEYEALYADFADQFVERSFEITPYTYGQKLEARRLATTWENGEPRFDSEAFKMRLVAMALGCNVTDVEGMSPVLFPTLAREVLQRCEPDIEQLRFFASPSTTLPQGSTSKASRSSKSE